MIVEHYDMSFSDKLELITQVVSNFGYRWAIVLLFIIIVSWLAHKQEKAGKGYSRCKRRI